jgi:hypothetical protein
MHDTVGHGSATCGDPVLVVLCDARPDTTVALPPMAGRAGQRRPANDAALAAARRGLVLRVPGLSVIRRRGCAGRR